jgi:DNA-binding response OmpR family regulator
MKNPLILLVEDEPILAEIVRESLQTRGFEVLHADTVKAATLLYHQQTPSLMVLDVMLPDGDGFSLARHIRSQDMELPIIFLTSRSLPQDVVEGFESGGNDYLKKPFSLEELVVRIKALLNRNRLVSPVINTAQTTALGQYLFEYPASALTFMGKKRTLTSREGEIMHMLILSKNQVLYRKALLLHLWGNDDYFSGRSLDVFMAKLRKYLKDDPTVNILNIRGQGYKLIYD